MPAVYSRQWWNVPASQLPADLEPELWPVIDMATRTFGYKPLAHSFTKTCVSIGHCEGQGSRTYLNIFLSGGPGVGAHCLTYDTGKKTLKDNGRPGSALRARGGRYEIVRDTAALDFLAAVNSWREDVMGIPQAVPPAADQARIEELEAQLAALTAQLAALTP